MSSGEVVRQLDVSNDPLFDLLRRAAEGSGGEMWVVGGYVRDRLLGRDAHPDVDVVVVDASARDLAERVAVLAGAPPPAVFERFGTAQVTWDERRLEFVAARRESYRPESRKPDVEPATLDEDLRRRDFTVNALVCDLSGAVHDPLGGLPDLEQRVLRTPLDPRATFRDDPLRMLRAARFAAQLGFRLAPDLPPAMRELADRLRPPVVSVERVADELWKLLRSPRPRLGLQLLDAGGLLAVVLPEVAACQGVEQGGWHPDDVYQHTLATVERTPPQLLQRLAALFHDVGKPATGPEGGHFPNHEQVGARLAAAALRRLRASTSVTESVAKLVRLHLRPVFYDASWTDGAVRRLARAAGDLLWPLLDLARADVGASTYPHPEELDELEARLRRVLAEEPDRFTPPITGDDIMAALGIRPGPAVGRIKAELEELVLDGVLPPEREALLAYLRERAAT